MSDPSYRDIVRHYESCLEQHGDTHLGVDWPKAEHVPLRYGVMLDVVPASATARELTLLDFGCGAGHLVEYLKGHRLRDARYVGVDLSSKFIDLCRSKYPDLEFHCVDALAEGASLPEHDFAILNGVLTEKRSLSHDEMWSYAQRLLKRVFEKTRRGMAFNVMSKHVDWERDDLFHLPFDVAAAFFKRELSARYAFRADYGLYEYTAYVYR